MCLDFDHDQNHEPCRGDNQNGMNSLELSTPDFESELLESVNQMMRGEFAHEVVIDTSIKSVPTTNELSDSLDDYLTQNKDIIF